MTLAPLPLIDDFLLPYNVGQALLVVFLLSVLGILPLKSRKVLSLNFVTFGLIFVMTPSQLAPIQFKFLGIALLVLGPLVYVTGQE
jgi:uncharacterized membrane protein